jgi:hypothetical protein
MIAAIPDCALDGIALGIIAAYERDGVVVVAPVDASEELLDMLFSAGNKERKLRKHGLSLQEGIVDGYLRHHAQP